MNSFRGASVSILVTTPDTLSSVSMFPPSLNEIEQLEGSLRRTTVLNEGLNEIQQKEREGGLRSSSPGIEGIP